MVVYDRLLKILHFIIIIEKITAEGLAKLFRNNVWKLYVLLENMILDRGPQFATKLIKKLNKILRIEMKLLTNFYLQIDR